MLVKSKFEEIKSSKLFSEDYCGLSAVNIDMRSSMLDSIWHPCIVELEFKLNYLYFPLCYRSSEIREEKRNMKLHTFYFNFSGLNINVFPCSMFSLLPLNILNILSFNTPFAKDVCDENCLFALAQREPQSEHFCLMRNNFSRKYFR